MYQKERIPCSKPLYVLVQEVPKEYTIKNVILLFEASAGVTVCSYNSWVVTQRRFSLVRNQCFGTVYSSHLQGETKIQKHMVVA
jgi:hypothetical protein